MVSTILFRRPGIGRSGVRENANAEQETRKEGKQEKRRGFQIEAGE